MRDVGERVLPRVDLICGGFPCQDVSSAGARQGLSGKCSGLWTEFYRVASELRPKWVVVENVASGANLWVDDVSRDLARIGYQTIPVPLRADALGAPYRRARVFVIGRRRLADSDEHVQYHESEHTEMASTPEVTRAPGGARCVADTDGGSLREQPRGCCRAPRKGAPVAVANSWREPMPRVDGLVSGSTRRLAQRAAGNCVVPLCAQVIGEMIKVFIARDTHNNGARLIAPGRRRLLPIRRS